MLFNKQLFILAHQAGDIKFYPNYKCLVKNQWRPYNELKVEQEKRLHHIINYSYEYVPYYRKLFHNLGISPTDIRHIEDLEKIPILTKEIIKKNWEDLKPANLEKIKHYSISTGGSTGSPLNYRITKFERFLSGAIMYRGWGYGGYQLSDKMIYFAGASLDCNTKINFSTKLQEIVRNVKKISSFDMSPSDLQKDVDLINSVQPQYIYGYPSSLFFLSEWMNQNDINIFKPNAIFTTSEKLFPHMRDTISATFNCELFDGYGLNDSGVTANECSEHSGLHIDTERSILEMIDEHGNQIVDGEGLILGTSLYNFAMPFIRYDTGDLGTITDERCSCGRGYKLLREIVGRSADILYTPEGKNIHGWFFLMIFWEYGERIKEYQVVQEKLDTILIKIVPEENFDNKCLELIKNAIRQRSDRWNIEIKFVDHIERSISGKFKFIVNLM